jgi:hypothetical protein
MRTALEETLVVELMQMLDRHAQRQAELVGCLKALRADLLALGLVSGGEGFEEPRAGPRIPNWARSQAPMAEVATRRAPRSLPRLPSRTTSLSSRPASRLRETNAERPDAALGSPGHAPRRNYNYFADLDAKLARTRGKPGPAPLATVTQSSEFEGGENLDRAQ